MPCEGMPDRARHHSLAESPPRIVTSFDERRGRSSFTRLAHAPDVPRSSLAPLRRSQGLYRTTAPPPCNATTATTCG